jgi:hypothetical protein
MTDYFPPLRSGKGWLPRTAIRLMAVSDRDTLLRSIEDFERTLVEFQSNNVVLQTTVLLRRLDEIGVSATALGDPVLIAMTEKLRRQLTTGNGLDG